MERLRRMKEAVEAVTFSDVLAHVTPAAAAGAPATAARATGGGGGVRVTNLVDGEVLPYSLCLLEGTAPAGVTGVAVSVGGAAPAPASFPAVGGVWKGAVDLVAGPNRLTLSPVGGSDPAATAAPGGGAASGGGGTAAVAVSELTLTYDAASDGAGPPGTKSVRLVWLRSADGDGSFEVPPRPHPGWNVPHAAADGAARLRTAGRLMQAATAEMMARQGLGRRTFRLAPGVVTLRLGGISTAAAHGMSGHALWRAVYDAADVCQRRDDYIDVAVMSFSSWDAAAKKALAHTALGGGRLGLFGGSAVWSWPAATADIATTFTDSRPVDGAVCLDDGGRRRVWALAATTIGAALHELGHCLSLPHPCLEVAADRGGGIMARGFDHLNRLLAVTEGGVPLGDEGGEPFWDRGCAARLRWHPYVGAVGRRPVDGGDSGGGGGLLDRALRAQRRLYDATPAVPMPAHRPLAAATPAPAPVTLDDLSRALGGLLHPSSAAAVAAAAPPPPGADGAVTVLPTPYSDKIPPGRGPHFATASDGRTIVLVGRGGGCGRGLGHLGYYVNGDNAGHDEWAGEIGGGGQGGAGGDPPPADVLLPTPAALRARLGAKEGDRLSVSAIDTAGNMASKDL